MESSISLWLIFDSSRKKVASVGDEDFFEETALLAYLIKLNEPQRHREGREKRKEEIGNQRSEKGISGCNGSAIAL